MPRRPIRVVADGDQLRAGFEAIRADAGLPDAFPDEVEAEARAAAERGPDGDVERADLTGVPFVTVDPPGSRDLDQALHIAPAAGGWIVRYAIADVAAFVVPGGAIDLEARRRGATVYAPHRRVPLHPAVLSEDAASLLPGVERPALVWELGLDEAGELQSTALVRARVRSRRQMTYEEAQADPVTAPLRTVGELRLAVERARGGVHLPVPEQEIVPLDGSFTLRYRAGPPVEEHNAQISLLAGMAAAAIMLGRGGPGVLRTLPPPDEKRLAALRLAASALGVPWPDGVTYPEWVRTLDPAVPRHAALLHQATGVARGAAYLAFAAGETPGQPSHSAIAAPYAHVTAPLRRLVDRPALEVCHALANELPVPAWASDMLPELPKLMAEADRRAGQVDRAAVDLVEAALLAGRIGEVLPAVAISADQVQLTKPAIRARVPDAGFVPGTEVRVRVQSADIVRRTVVLAPENQGADPDDTTTSHMDTV